MTCSVIQTPAEVWYCELLPWLQCHAGLLPHHGHESQPSVQWPLLQETTRGVQSVYGWPPKSPVHAGAVSCQPAWFIKFFMSLISEERGRAAQGGGCKGGGGGGTWGQWVGWGWRLQSWFLNVHHSILHKRAFIPPGLCRYWTGVRGDWSRVTGCNRDRAWPARRHHCGVHHSRQGQC